MKKYSIYIGLLAVGLLLGWFFFGNSSTEEKSHEHNDLVEVNQMWTCSMHPQIMKPEPGDCPICGMDLIPAENGAVGLAVDQFKLTENALALANIQTSVVGIAKDNTGFVKLSGKIVENEEANAIQVSYFSGRIERLNVSFTGEKVRKGQLLATIYSPELFAAQQELLTAITLKESQPALYNAVRNKLKLWKLTDNQIDQIEKSGKVKENFPVYATVSGTVSEKLVEQGASIKQGQPLLKIANLNTVWANFDVYENQINLFKIGQEVEVTTKSYPSKVFKSKIVFIDPVLNSRTRTIKLRVILNNIENAFKPGMFVEGKVKAITKEKNSNLTIPASAILWTGERSVVYIKADPKDPIFEMREVVLGDRLGDSYLIMSGLNNGDEIVTNGTFTIDAAAQLQGKKSMMNKEGGKTTTGHEGHIGINASQNETNKKIEVSSKFKAQLKVLVEDYINFKNALVLGDNSNAHRISKELLITLADVNMKLLTDEEAHNEWMKVDKQLKTVLNTLNETTKIEEQRAHFINLSTVMTKTIQLFGINQKVYEQFCPMANDDKGATWLSFESEIKNPYFGKVMLKCGNTVSEIN